MSSAEARYDELLEWAYLGEVFGAAVFTYLLGTDTFPERRVELGILLDLELQTRDRLEPLAVERGLGVEHQETLSRAAEFALDMRTLDWPQFMSETESVGGDALPLLRELVHVAPPASKQLLTSVVEHEVALISFARHTLAGDVPVARSAIVDHLTAHAY